MPDSVLAPLCSYFETENAHHVVTANEGSAVGLACGTYLGSGELPLVYLQNSGLGNAINPLISLADSRVYGIPMFLLIGWRGAPFVSDEPQHRKQGESTEELLRMLDIPFKVLDEETCENQCAELCQLALDRSAPAALLVPKGALKSKPESRTPDPNMPQRAEVIEQLLDLLDSDTVVVSTTGWTSRELHTLRSQKDSLADLDFLNVGAMGHCSQIALGIAVTQPERTIFCLDGDGSCLMHLGGLTTIGEIRPKNFKHLLFNNGMHESVGGSPVTAPKLSFRDLAAHCGYVWTAEVADKKSVKAQIQHLLEQPGPALLEVKVSPGTLPQLGRPQTTPQERKMRFKERISR